MVTGSPDRPADGRGARPAEPPPRTRPPRRARPPPHLAAVVATASVGLPFAGVDLAAENGGAAFEVNVHPAFVDGELERVAVPYAQAHLDLLARARDRDRDGRGVWPGQAGEPSTTGAPTV